MREIFATKTFNFFLYYILEKLFRSPEKLPLEATIHSISSNISGALIEGLILRISDCPFDTIFRWFKIVPFTFVK